MEIRLILVKEIGFGISLDNRADSWQIKRMPLPRENREANFPFLKQA